MHINVTVLVMFFFYLLVLLWIGWYSSNKIQSNVDFSLAGRRLGMLTLAGSLAATEIGGGSSLGVITTGMEGYGLGASWYVLSMGAAFLILALIVPMIRKTNATSVSDFMTRRYGKSCGLPTSCLMLLTTTGLTVSQIIVSAALLTAMMPIDYQVSVIIISVVVTVYSMMGGLWSVALTDGLQIVLTILGMLLTLPFAIRYAGGWSSVITHVPAETLQLFHGYKGAEILALIVMYVTTFSVGQEVTSRFYAAKDSATARKSATLSAAINFIYAFIPAVLGIVMMALIRMHKIDLATYGAVDSQYAFPLLVAGIMPPLVGGLLFVGIISATMSSSDSDLLSAGTVVGNDIYKAHVRPDASDAQVTRVTKTAICAVGLLSMMIAIFNTASVLRILTFCFAIRGAGIFFPFLLGHFWKRASRAGTIASLVSGTVVVYLVNANNGDIFGLHFEQPIIPGLVASLCCFLLFSVIAPEKDARTNVS